MTHDSLLEMFMSIRQQRPPIFMADEWKNWLEAIGDTIGAMRKPERRWASMILVASDLTQAMPGLLPELAFVVVEQAVNRAAVIHADRR